MAAVGSPRVSLTPQRAFDLMTALVLWPARVAPPLW